jgi:transmembrane sensor
VNLSDGSTVTLNADTKLRSQVSARGRTVYLDRGEALFTVTHDAQHEFVVRVGTHVIRDVGTTFVVRRLDEGSTAEIFVVQGAVSIDSVENKSQTRYTLHAGALAKVSEGGLQRMGYLSQEATECRLRWTQGALCFNGETLAEVVRQINLYSPRKLYISDAQLGQMLIGGSVDPSHIPAIILLLEKSLRVKVVPVPGVDGVMLEVRRD